MPLSMIHLRGPSYEPGRWGLRGERGEQAAPPAQVEGEVAPSTPTGLRPAERGGEGRAASDEADNHAAYEALREARRDPWTGDRVSLEGARPERPTTYGRGGRPAAFTLRLSPMRRPRLEEIERPQLVPEPAEEAAAEARASLEGEAAADPLEEARAGEPGEGEAREGARAEGDEASRSGQPELSAEDLEMIDKLEARDVEVRAHEQAHKSAGGQLAGAVSYSYQRGPDNERYAIGGEVSIDLSPVAGDPAATVRKMAQVQRAALAPAEPSGQDRAVAAQAAAQAASARAEVTAQKAEEAGEASEGNEGSEAEEGAEAQEVAPPRGAERSPFAVARGDLRWR